MNKMITELCQLLKETTDMIAFEEAATRYMNDTFTKVVSEVFRAVNQHLVEEARTGGARVERNQVLF